MLMYPPENFVAGHHILCIYIISPRFFMQYKVFMKSRGRSGGSLCNLPENFSSAGAEERADGILRPGADGGEMEKHAVYPA
jgi:hypothetical protein